MSRRKLTALGALAAAVLAGFLATRLWPSRAPADPAPGAAGSPLAGGNAGGPAGARGAQALPKDRAELAAFLRARFGAHIASSYVQLQMLEKLMRHFQAQSPGSWEAELLAAVRAAFPERYDEIAALLKSRVAYEAWLKENEARLKGVTDGERREALREARQRLFGEQAASEIWASEQKNQAVTDALAAIDVKPGATVAERLALYKDSILDTHQEGADAFLEAHRQESLGRFLGLDSVQRELAAMAPDARAAALRDVRKGLGLDGDALRRWDTLDQERDRRWETGRRYMAERAALAKEHTGEALEAHLKELRARYFGAEAETIADEEATGFFRFDQPRKYGVN